MKINYKTNSICVGNQPISTHFLSSTSTFNQYVKPDLN